MAKAVWAAVFALFGVSVGIAQASISETTKLLPLDMAPNAVDDMYAGCEKDMEGKVRSEFLQNEKNKVQYFNLVWNEAEKYYNSKWKPKPGRKHKRTLNKEQAMAIYAYTLDKPNIYPEFNAAVRTQKSEYKTTFKYHTLHFFLTTALQTLNSRKPLGERCLTSFRRVDQHFSQDALNKEIRFGSFTSSSLGQYPRPDKFGDKTCFEISTCFGADISLYSKVGEFEREVLIPPYEIFKVTEIDNNPDTTLLCKIVYKLKSTKKFLSNLNCSLFSRQ